MIFLKKFQKVKECLNDEYFLSKFKQSIMLKRTSWDGDSGIVPDT